MRYLILSLSCLMMSHLLLVGQTTTDKPVLPKESGEIITLNTDRSLYCANEPLFFSAGYNKTPLLNSVQWSKVLYLELINSEGLALVQAKFELDEQGASGQLMLPPSLLSGNYYLRAYTRWMRNYPVTEYAYRCIKVVNVHEPAIAPAPANALTDSLPHGKVPLNAPLAVKCNKAVYNCRQRVHLDFDLPPGAYCITVVPQGAVGVKPCKPVPVWAETTDPADWWLAEKRGLVIAGTVLNKSTMQPAANTEVHLASVNNNEYYSMFSSLADGRFYFNMPQLYGNSDFFLEALSDQTSKQELGLRLESEFCTRKLKLPYIAFELTDNEKALVQKLAINAQLNSRFATPQQSKQATSAPFYGSSKKAYYTKDFIELPKLKDFFAELVLEVQVVEKQNQSYLRLSNSRDNFYMSPLVLIDNMRVPNLWHFLDMPCKKVARVEVIDHWYSVADRNYNGLIMVFTKKKDFGGLDLNPNSTFFNMDMYSHSARAYPTDALDQPAAREANRRNTVYWNPQILLGQNTPKLSFITPDAPGKYTVLIQGLGAANSTAIGITAFEVKQ